MDQGGERKESPHFCLSVTLGPSGVGPGSLDLRALSPGRPAGFIPAARLPGLPALPGFIFAYGLGESLPLNKDHMAFSPFSFPPIGRLCKPEQLPEFPRKRLDAAQFLTRMTVSPQEVASINLLKISFFARLHLSVIWLHCGVFANSGSSSPPTMCLRTDDFSELLPLLDVELLDNGSLDGLCRSLDVESSDFAG